MQSIHTEITQVFSVVEDLAHLVASYNVPQTTDLMKSAVVELAAKLELLLALEEAIASAFTVDLTDDDLPF